MGMWFKKMDLQKIKCSPIMSPQLKNLFSLIQELSLKNLLSINCNSGY